MDCPASTTRWPMRRMGETTPWTDSQAGRLASIRTSAAPAAIGPYSQAIVAGGWLFASGQIAIDPGSGKLVKGDITAQTERVMRNLSAIPGGRGEFARPSRQDHGVSRGPR